jgi:hypothetical protein
MAGSQLATFVWRTSAISSVSDECLSASVAFDIGSYFVVRVGSKRGEPIVLQVDAGKMHGAGFQFFLSVNGVWLTDSVPAIFLVRP